MYNTLVLSGGGPKIFILIGALMKIDTSNITHFSGTSAGSILCYLLAIGYTIDEIYMKIIDSRIINHIVRINGISDMLNQKSVIDMDIIRNFLETLTRDKVGHLLTFQQLHTMGKSLSIPSYNMTKRTLVYFSHDTYPNTHIIDAIIASSTIPLVCPRYELDGDEYIDGGTVVNFPIYTYTSNEHQAIGINVDKEDVYKTCGSYFDFMYEISNIPNILYRNSQKEPTNIHIIQISPANIPFSFHITKEDIHFMMNVGKDAVMLPENV